MSDNLFSPGKNIAMNVLPEKFEETVKFYSEILGFRIVDSETPNCVGIAYGEQTLWIDANKKIKQPEIFFEISVTDLETAKEVLQSQNIEACENPFETLSETYRGFWVRNPAGVIHLVDEVGSED